MWTDCWDLHPLLLDLSLGFSFTPLSFLSRHLQEIFRFPLCLAFLEIMSSLEWGLALLTVLRWVSCQNFYILLRSHALLWRIYTLLCIAWFTLPSCLGTYKVQTHFCKISTRFMHLFSISVSCIFIDLRVMLSPAIPLKYSGSPGVKGPTLCESHFMFCSSMFSKLNLCL